MCIFYIYTLQVDISLVNYIFQILKIVQCSSLHGLYVFYTLFPLVVSAVLNVLEDHDDIYWTLHSIGNLCVPCLPRVKGTSATRSQFLEVREMNNSLQARGITTYYSVWK